MAAQLRDLTDDLWIWRVERHGHEVAAREPLLSATCVRSGGELILLDPVAPAAGELDALWQRLDAEPPTLLIVLKPDHVRDVDAFATRYGARAMGPALFWPDDVPATVLEPIDPGDRLPGGLLALHDGRGRDETPLWLPEQRTIVFADALVAPGGELRIWSTPWHQARALPALRALLELPFERVIVSHGEPVHDRAEFERALERAPFRG